MEPKVKAMGEWMRAFSDLYPCGGVAHVVTDDGNLEDEDIRFCLKEADSPDCFTSHGPEHFADAKALLTALLALTEEEREDAYEYSWGR